MTENTALIEMIKRHEGLRLKPYKCTAGKLTIGYGRNLEAKGITRDEAEAMLTKDLQDAERDAREYAGVYWISLNEARRAVLVDMSFAMGLAGLKAWKGLLRALAKGDYMLCAESLRSSKWYRGPAVARVEELAKIMETGKWPLIGI